MARTLDQIIAELNPTFNPQIASLEQRANLIPGQIAAEESALNAQKDQGYQDIISGARRRGVGFSGIPLGEQAQYNATQYAPALARLRQTGQERAMSLQDAILGIRERQNTFGQQLYQQELDREAQQQAARAAAASPTLGSLASLFGQQGGAPRIAKTNNGFNFFDASGQPITATQYSQAAGVPIQTLLSNLANDGDSNARLALKYMGPNGTFTSIPAQYKGAFGALGISAPISTANPVQARTNTGMSVRLPSIINGTY